MALTQLTEAEADLFWEKVNRVDGLCWDWLASRVRDRYGRFAQRRRSFLAHRVSWMIHHGQMPDDMEIDHLCGNPACVRPDHLRIVPLGFNVKQGRERARDGLERFYESQRSKEHCAHGHPRTDENTYIRKDGRKQCRVCVNISWARWRAANKEA